MNTSCCWVTSVMSNSTDSSPPGSCVPGILQARTPEWAAVSSSKYELLSSFPVSGAPPSGPTSGSAETDAQWLDSDSPPQSLYTSCGGAAPAPGRLPGQMLWYWDKPTAIRWRWRNHLISAVFTHKSWETTLKKKKKWFCLFPKLFVNNFASKIGSQANAITQVW